MNYIEHHFGDYLKRAGHLSLLEHGVYARLRDTYLANEVPIPDAKAERLIMARTPDECAAVRMVLGEFFALRDGAWHRSEFDDAIVAFQQGEPEREAKKANEATRLHKHRDERARLFKALTDAGQHADWNIKIGDLRALVAALPATRPATPETPATITGPWTDGVGAPELKGSRPDMPVEAGTLTEWAAGPVTAAASATPETFQATASATPATATQYPIPNTHSPEEKKEAPKRRASRDALFDAAALDLPDWLDREDWCMWVRHRATKRRPFTEESARLSIKSLDKMRADGIAPKDAIEHGVASGNQGLFPPPISRGKASSVGTRPVNYTTTDYTEDV